jgi:hypothetical protein
VDASAFALTKLAMRIAVKHLSAFLRSIILYRHLVPPLIASSVPIATPESLVISPVLAGIQRIEPTLFTVSRT